MSAGARSRGRQEVENVFARQLLAVSSDRNKEELVLPAGSGRDERGKRPRSVSVGRARAEPTPSPVADLEARWLRGAGAPICRQRHVVSPRLAFEALGPADA